MNKFSYFKVAFLSITVFIFITMLIKGLFDIDFSNTNDLFRLLRRSLFASIVVGLLMGLLNMFFKINFFSKKEN